jgi:hypothetical protein
MAALAKTSIVTTDLFKVITFTGSSGSDTIALTASDGQTGIIINNTNATAGQIATVTLKAGTGILSALGDVVIAIPISSMVHINLNAIGSARLKDLAGNLTVTVAVAAAGVVASVLIGIAEEQ